MKLKRLRMGSVLCLIVFAQLTALSIFLPSGTSAWPSATEVAGPETPREMVRSYSGYWSLRWCSSPQGGAYSTYLQQAVSSSDMMDGKIFNSGDTHWRNYFVFDSNAEADCNKNAAALLSYLGVHKGGNGNGVMEFLTKPYPLPRGADPIPATYIWNNNLNRYDINPDMTQANFHLLLSLQATDNTPYINFNTRTMPNWAQYFVYRDTFLGGWNGSTSLCVDGLDPNADSVEVVSVLDNTVVEWGPGNTTNPSNTFIINNSQHRLGYGTWERITDDVLKNPRKIGCRDIADKMNQFADDAKIALEAWYNANPDGEIEDDDAGVGAEDQGATCESGGGFAWLFCGLLHLASDALDKVDGWIAGLLDISTENFTEEFRDAWAILRNLAYLILVPMMLIMVISTALGFDFISAYTVKSALPRMIIAVIFIALSYDITVFIVNFVQTIGHGIHNLLLNPFSVETATGTIPLAEASLEDMVPIPDSGLIQAGLTGLVAWGAIAALTGGGVVMLLAGALGVGALIMFLVLTLILFRQAIIVLLVLLAPLAILPWIFPGRDKLWGIWNKTFWLMMWFFPLIMMATAAGKIMAWLVRYGGL